MLLSRIKVIGHSMEPTLRHKSMVIASSIPFFFGKPKIGDIVILKRNGYIIKRITKVKKDKFFVLGDNKKESTDSRDFGFFERKEIVAKVLYKIKN